MSTITLLCIALAGVIMLLLLVIKAKVQPFVALLLVGLLVALAAGVLAGREEGRESPAGRGGGSCVHRFFFFFAGRWRRW